MEKEQFRGTNIGHKISHLCFSVPSTIALKRQSHIQCINHGLYDKNPDFNSKGRKPAAYGVLDFRLGEHFTYVLLIMSTNGINEYRHQSKRHKM